MSFTQQSQFGGKCGVIDILYFSDVDTADQSDLRVRRT